MGTLYCQVLTEIRKRVMMRSLMLARCSLAKQEDEQYLTPDEACKYLEVSRRTLERYVADGRITKYRRGVKRTVLFKRSELDRLLEIRPDSKGEEDQ